MIQYCNLRIREVYITQSEVIIIINNKLYECLMILMFNDHNLIGCGYLKVHHNTLFLRNIANVIETN